jgi:hypothetical protein
LQFRVEVPDYVDAEVLEEYKSSICRVKLEPQIGEELIKELLSVEKWHTTPLMNLLAGRIVSRVGKYYLKCEFLRLLKLLVVLI